MSFTIKTTRLFEKDFAKLETHTQTRVLEVLEMMRTGNFVNSKKLKNVIEGVYRIRIGDYRLRFDIIAKDIYLYRVRHRKDVYKD